MVSDSLYGKSNKKSMLSRLPNGAKMGSPAPAEETPRLDGTWGCFHLKDFKVSGRAEAAVVQKTVISANKI